ncbi:shikimate dehydrogenase [Phenylobacterium sp.]|jgi:shikimate dehydrogenase|uniref:shikimate dehydrogenase n=1 Tax=Phenylobacterium sp. TaxID=1871053 RepID=UPI002F93436C
MITGRTVVAGVAGNPVAHSLSPLIHNAWLAKAGVDGVYVAFSPPADGFRRFAEGLRGGAVRGLNVTVPFKEDAFALADRLSPRAKAAGAVNLLVFEADGTIAGDNTDGEGLLGALARQAGFDPTSGPAVILGAGGAARGAATTLAAAGSPEVRIVNRTLARAEAIAGLADGVAFPLDKVAAALDGAAVVINATTAGLSGQAALDVPLGRAPDHAVVMDMVYKPLVTPFLQQARDRGLRTVDGLEMLIRQAAPSFEAFFGRPPPQDVDVRGLALAALEG